ncbi:MAG: class I SAM-dependent methyltransferase [bacterium]|nr:class I SAM-dependent methyltransferase [bacterium]
MRLAIFVILCAAALAQSEHQQHHPPRSATEYVEHLENPKRDAWQQPERVVEALNLKSDEVVADIGAGTGYFSRRIAGQAAKVYAVDIEAELLDKIDKAGVASVETVLAAPDDPRLAPGSVDTIFICNVLHHIHNRPAYYAKLSQALKPGGRIVILEFFKRDLPVGPPVSMKLSEQAVEEELRAAGFRKAASHDLLVHQYMLEFRRAD